MNIKNIVLDIDNTLLWACPKRETKIKGDFSFDVDYEIFIRPQLYTFLDYIFSKYNVGIFTAACKDYALDVVNHILPQYKDKIQFIFHSSDYWTCKVKTGGKKDLNFVSEHTNFLAEETIIIDDCYEVKYTNGDRCIQIKRFLGESDDSEFLKIMSLL